MTQKLKELVDHRRRRTPIGITSVCSAHPLVLRAALKHGAETNSTVLVEATCNQVNHLGGYTGMTPVDFAKLVSKIAEEENCPQNQIILGGDHIGPNPWRDRSAEDAMLEAEKMVAAYVAAGFRKIHLDASMGCLNEPVALDDETTAHRAARLAKVADDVARRAGGDMPVYIIGTEVPPPGGADHVLDGIVPTRAVDAKKTIAVHRAVFEEVGVGDAFARAIGVVVQPGVEFGNHNIIRYDRDAARDLVGVLDVETQFIFEAHSTDYQGRAPLAQLVADGFGILKVGPELTFVLREALYALDAIATDLLPDYGHRPLWQAMEAEMLSAPTNWDRHYYGDAAEVRMLRHYSLSDRIRYYWPAKGSQAAVGNLMQALRGRQIPLPLIWQFLPGAVAFADTPFDPEAVLVWRVQQTLEDYHAACTGKLAP